MHKFAVHKIIYFGTANNIIYFFGLYIFVTKKSNVSQINLKEMLTLNVGMVCRTRKRPTCDLLSGKKKKKKAVMM